MVTATTPLLSGDIQGNMCSVEYTTTEHHQRKVKMYVKSIETEENERKIIDFFLSRLKGIDVNVQSKGYEYIFYEITFTASLPCVSLKPYTRTLYPLDCDFINEAELQYLLVQLLSVLAKQLFLKNHKG